MKTQGISLPLLLSAALLLIVFVSAENEAKTPLVNTPYGKVRGDFQKTYEGRTVIAFEGVPYAQPPVGDLRFKEPQPITPWSDVLLANVTYVCIQFMAFISATMGTEDCLYLYIYILQNKFSPNANLDVVVHIHGGAFMFGAPNFLGGPQYITDRDVVYVSFNYRLGIFGFLSTEDDVIPGNYGLKDQVMALKWIKNNIKYFGGNPNSITLTGSSAGAASVHYHYLSPLSKDLFHRGYSMSGTALNAWALTENASQKARQLGAHLNCPYECSQTLLECLREKKSTDIIEMLKHFFKFVDIIPFTPFGPVVEKVPNAFLPHHPYSLLQRGEINDLPWVCSNTKNEGIFPVGFIVLYRKLNELDEKWNEIMPYALDYVDTTSEEERSAITSKIRDYYFNDKKLSIGNIDKLIDLFTDRGFLVDSEMALKLHAKVSKAPVYYYFFEYKSALPSLFPTEITGVAHGEDGRLFFYQVGNPEVFEERDEKMKKLFVDFIYDFGKAGVPKIGAVDWTPVNDSEKINYLHILYPDNIVMNSTTRFTPRDFWDNLPIRENGRLYENSRRTSVGNRILSSTILKLLSVIVWRHLI